ncbi:hypothetical protein [uncultured Photobacterium sp.]|uniref:hypothetical protein n=1 Tax=uncultured Photobacterium sp. TaxID=173973 RepID=UPI0026067A95|nr:hypothetical protein [uncultured Photobacterium sp.]
MKRKITLSALLILLVLSLSLDVFAKSSKAEKCLKTREKIEMIHKKMRHKYTFKQGEKYRKKLEKLYKDEFKFCF